jgi:hypothetical protein
MCLPRQQISPGGYSIDAAQQGCFKERPSEEKVYLFSPLALLPEEGMMASVDATAGERDR